MSTKMEEQQILLRTFDLPDIHFVSVSGLDGNGKSFVAMRFPEGDSLDAIALDRWQKQSRFASDAESRRDCWLQINDRIYVIWGASIKALKEVDGGNGAVEHWEFSFDEMKRYRPTPN